jgi:hypothetical protein
MDDSAVKQLTKNGSGYPEEFRELRSVVERVRRKVFANRLIASWTVALNWIFLGVIVLAALSRTLKHSLMAAGTLAAFALIAFLVREWLRRPSDYLCARELDQASGLSDRLSTALYFGALAHPDPMTLWQRRDALSKVNSVRNLDTFPLRVPEFAKRTAILAVIAMGLLAYRIQFSPPVMALLQRAATSQVARGLLSPMAGAVKREVMALVSREETPVKEAAADAETVPGLAESKNASDPSQMGDKDGAAPGDMQDDSDSATAGAEGDPGNPQPGASPQGQDAAQSGSASENQQMADANQPPSSENGQSGSSQQQQQGAGQSSSGSSVMQALKNLMKNMSGQPTSNDSNGQPSSPGSSQQQGSSSGQGEAKNDSPKDGSEQKETGSSSSSQKPGGGAGNGSTPVPKQSGKDAPPPPKNLPQDRVNLQANDFREQGHVRTTSAAGTAQLPLRDIKPQPVAAIKGAEQENIPVRYRLYVQHYFERTDKAPGQIQPPR